MQLQDQHDSNLAGKLHFKLGVRQSQIVGNMIKFKHAVLLQVLQDLTSKELTVSVSCQLAKTVNYFVLTSMLCYD